MTTEETTDDETPEEIKVPLDTGMQLYLEYVNRRLKIADEHPHEAPPFDFATFKQVWNDRVEELNTWLGIELRGDNPAQTKKRVKILESFLYMDEDTYATDYSRGFYRIEDKVSSAGEAGFDDC